MIPSAAWRSAVSRADLYSFVAEFSKNVEQIFRIHTLSNTEIFDKNEAAARWRARALWHRRICPQGQVQGSDDQIEDTE